jgi:acetyl esterase/lipase
VTQPLTECFAAPGGRELFADVFHPAGWTPAGRTVQSEPLPAVVFLHGGGWARGDRTLAPDLATFFAADGFVMASFDYRLSSESVFPAQLYDVRAGIRWLRQNAGRLGVDPERIAVWGSSAGGHLAALAGTTSHLPALPGEPDGGGVSAAVQTVVAGYGPVDFLRLPDGGADPGSFEAQLLGGAPASLPELAASANPAGYAGAEAPPFLIMHGLADTAVPALQSELLYEALAAAGAEAELHLIDGYGHGFFNAPDLPDFQGPAFLDNGALQTRPGAASLIRRSRRGTPLPEEHATASYGTVRSFLIDHLKAPHTARSAHAR